MASNTYVALATQTLGSAAASVTFSSIPSTYTDLVLVVDMSSTTNAANYLYMQYNGDTGSNYSTTILSGDGATAVSVRFANRTNFNIDYSATPKTERGNRIINIMNYANTTTYKTGLVRSNRAGGGADGIIGLWRSTAAINSITITCDSDTFATGSTFSLYGVASASVGAKATGGNLITSDANYYYHVFTGSGTFTPLQSLSADVLCVAGGGGGGYAGGGAGGLRTGSLSLSATGYSVTIGAGGAGGAGGTINAGTSGVDSVFSSITSTGGGGGGGANSSPAYNGKDGGSGGGAGYAGGTFGLGNTPSTSPSQGNNGGTTSGTNGLGGGGGAGAVGGNGTSSVSGVGGAGTNTYSSWASATGTGVSGFYAGGGGAGASGGASTPGAGGSGGGGTGGTMSPASNGVAGTANTGGGGGGGNSVATPNTGGAGGSGIVIVRYAK